jgi:hypothetical protein
MPMYQGMDDTLIKSYVDSMIENVTAGVARVNKTFEEVTLKSGTAKVSDLSFNRRLVKKDGSVVMNFENFDVSDITGTTGPIDDELITLSAWDNKGNLFAVLVNFTLHPAILVGYKWLISRDYIHYLDEYILEKYGSQAVTLFANGAEGNVNHLNYRDPDQLRSFEEAERIGKKLGSYVTDSLINSSALDGKIRFVSVRYPFRSGKSRKKSKNGPTWCLDGIKILLKICSKVFLIKLMPK